MKAKGDFFWRLDTALFNGIAATCLLASLYCFAWAALIAFVQILGWLKAGEWQAVPIYALFMSDDGQAMIRAYTGPLHPLLLVPSWGSTESLEQQAASIAGSAMGLRKIVTWLLDLPLIVALFVAAILLMYGFMRASEEAKTSEAKASPR